MVQIKKHPRNNRVDYFAPISYIDSSNMVSGASVAALNTSKIISRWSVPLVDMVAHWTGLGSICSSHEHKGYACKSSLVLDETSKLSECPGMLSTALSFSNRHSGSDAFEVFDGNHSTSVFGFSNNFLGDAMIGMCMKSPFFSRNPLEMPFSTSSSSFLETRFNSGISFSCYIDLLSTNRNSIAVSGNIDNSQIYPKSSYCIEFGRLRDFNHNGKIEYSISKDKVSLPSDSIQSDLLILSNSDWNNLPSVIRQDRNGFKLSPGKDALVIDNSPIRSEFGFDSSIPLISFGDFSNRPDSQLCREFELVPHIIINNLLKLNLISSPHFKSNIGNVVARFVKLMHSLKKSVMLFFRGIEFNHKRLHHSIDNGIQCLYNLRLGSGVRFLPVLKYRASATPAPHGGQ